ncbi:acyltransferase family protein [Blastopirellula retiformator]|uniref:Acyltransferase family protein n=1 Tax=Blastopirellula retiformator TaxID=2527970 RepID=A0A5C5VKT6_9BACT|nr:acyltransferase [Blastopirellula retiformator]TWT38613.1 Acyltransferase family protein [Blastopirellula retiformator]
MRVPERQSAHSAPPRSSAKPPERLVWIDAARLLAMGMVALQHLIKICDLEPSQVVLGLEPGPIGLAMFFSISGLLAAQDRHGDPVSWLTKRLTRIYLPYWIAVVGLLLLNYFVQYKPEPLSLVLAELAGVVVWTQQGDILGMYLWFVSLLLFCYLLTAVVKFERRVLPIMIAVSILWLWWDASFASFTLSFLTGLTLGLSADQPSPKIAVSIALGAAVLAFTVHPGFACVTIASLTMLTTAIPFSLQSHTTAIIARLSGMTYHFYLVHVPIYLAVEHFFPHRLAIVFLLGTAGAALGAVALYLLEIYLRKGFFSLTARQRQGSPTYATARSSAGSATTSRR